MISHIKMGDAETNRLLHVLYLFLTVGFIIAITFLVAGMDAVISFFFWIARRNDRAANRTGDLYWYVRWNQTEHPNRNRPIDLTLLREQQLAEDNERERLINNLETLRDEMRQLEMELSNNMHLREEQLNDVPAEPQDAGRPVVGVPFPMPENYDPDITNQIDDMARREIDEELHANAVAAIVGSLLARDRGIEVEPE